MKLGGPAGRVKVAKSLHWRPKTAAMQLVVGGRGDGLGLWVGLVGGRGQEKVRPTPTVMMRGGRFCHLTLVESGLHRLNSAHDYVGAGLLMAQKPSLGHP